MGGYVNEEVKEIGNVEKKPVAQKGYIPLVKSKQITIASPVEPVQSRPNILGNSETGFVMGFLGGILNLIVGSGIVGWVLFKFWEDSSVNGAVDKKLLIWLLALALWFLILGVWIIASSYWMKEPENLKKGSIVCLILGILSINPVVIIGAIIGLNEYKKQDVHLKSI